jgi:hypothetical protein
MNWQPIETYPGGEAMFFDEEKYKTWNSMIRAIEFGEAQSFAGVVVFTSRTTIIDPTHWAPLPSAPN